VREDTPDIPGFDTQVAEDGLSFFHGFLDCQYKSFSFSDCIAAATTLFQPSAFISRAHAAALEMFHGGLALDLPAIRELATKVERLTVWRPQ